MEGVKTLVAKAPENSSKVDNRQVSDLEAEIVARLSALADQKTASIRGVRREFSQRLSKAPSELVLRLALKLRRRRAVIFRFVAYELVRHHKSAFSSLNARSLEELGQGLDSWVAVDTFACYLAGPAWRERQVPEASIRRWARSKDRWWRRAALVSTVALNSKARGGRGDQPSTVHICAMLVRDRDDMVVKALSWALRELAKRDPKSVRGFLAEHEHELAPRVLREVNNKLVSGLKNPHRTRR
ncbi:MAG: DNA alkylation repair protein [Pyrinomonadaceae bacterium]|nr:DNA alkylation repair protein [Pyrinomonadaceae bacterium]